MCEFSLLTLCAEPVLSSQTAPSFSHGDDIRHIPTRTTLSISRTLLRYNAPPSWHHEAITLLYMRHFTRHFATTRLMQRKAHLSSLTFPKSHSPRTNTHYARSVAFLAFLTIAASYNSTQANPSTPKPYRAPRRSLSGAYLSSFS
jgi:hypothetical protein